MHKENGLLKDEFSFKDLSEEQRYLHSLSVLLIHF